MIGQRFGAFARGFSVLIVIVPYKLAKLRSNSLAYVLNVIY